MHCIDSSSSHSHDSPVWCTLLNANTLRKFSISFETAVLQTGTKRGWTNAILLNRWQQLLWSKGTIHLCQIAYCNDHPKFIHTRTTASCSISTHVVVLCARGMHVCTDQLTQKSHRHHCSFAHSTGLHSPSTILDWSM